MDLNKLAFEAFCSNDEEYRTKIKTLVETLVAQGETELSAMRKVRHAASDYYSYRATHWEKEQFTTLRGERCFKAVVNNDREQEQSLLATYGLFSTDIVSYGRNYYSTIKGDRLAAKINYDVVARKFIDSSKKHANAPKEDETTYVKFARSIAYSKFKSLTSIAKRLKLTDEYLTKMLEHLKEHRPEVYDLLMTNVHANSLIGATNKDAVEQRLLFVTEIRNKITLDKNYTIVDFYKETNGLSVHRFYQMYCMHYSIHTDPNFRNIIKFLGKDEEEDKLISVNDEIYRVILLEDGTKVEKGATLEQRKQVIAYIKKMGWPLTTAVYTSALDIIQDRPEFFNDNEYTRKF